MILSLWSNLITDFLDIDELAIRRQKRAAELGSKQEDGQPPKTNSHSGKGASGIPPTRGNTAIGASDEGDDVRCSRNQVRLFDEDGNQLGIVSILEANHFAKEKGLSIFIVQPNANPPMAKIMDRGRHKFELEKKNRETKRKHHIIDVKEIKIRYKIEPHDFETKLKHAQKFLQDGDRVKVLMILRGREMQHERLAQNLMQRFADQLQGVSRVDREIQMEGKSLLMVLAPAVT